MQPILVSVAEAARLLSVSRSTVYVLIASGQLSALKIGRLTRLERDRLLEFLKAPSQEEV